MTSKSLIHKNRPADYLSVDTSAGVLGITHPRAAVPTAGVLGPSTHSPARSSVPIPPTIPPEAEAVSANHPRSIGVDTRPPPHQTLYTPPGGPIFSGPDSDPCAALGCAMQTQPVETCRDHRCPHRWQREAKEDRARREEKDR